MPKGDKWLPQALSSIPEHLPDSTNPRPVKLFNPYTRLFQNIPLAQWHKIHLLVPCRFRNEYTGTFNQGKLYSPLDGLFSQTPIAYIKTMFDRCVPHLIPWTIPGWRKQIQISNKYQDNWTWPSWMPNHLNIWVAATLLAWTLKAWSNVLIQNLVK